MPDIPTEALEAADAAALVAYREAWGEPPDHAGRAILAGYVGAVAEALWPLAVAAGRAQAAADRPAVIMECADKLSTMAKRFRAKAQETGDKVHRATAAGLSIGAVKLIEMSDAAAGEVEERTDG